MRVLTLSKGQDLTDTNSSRKWWCSSPNNGKLFYVEYVNESFKVIVIQVDLVLNKSWEVYLDIFWGIFFVSRTIDKQGGHDGP